MRVGIVQLNSRDARGDNLAAIATAVAAAAGDGAQLVMLPEAAAYRGPLRPEFVESEDGPTYTALRELARRHRVGVLCGGLWLDSGQAGRPYNESALLDVDGRTLARYRKAHLFALDYDGVHEDEAAISVPGHELCCVDFAGWRLGLSICFDLRFPEQYRALAQAGADVLCVPANFARATGHWLPLLRARAIENLSYVLAPAQCGVAVDGFDSAGQSAAFGPWGQSLGCLRDAPGTLLVDLDRAALTADRAALGATRSRRRPELYAAPVAIPAPADPAPGGPR